MIEVLAPATGERLGEVRDLDADDIAAVVGTARAAQPGWAQLPVAKRAEVLRRMRAWVLSEADRVIATVVDETGKTWEDAFFAEIAYVTQALAFWARRGPGWIADERVRTLNPAVLGRGCRIRYAPAGVVGVIAPWNFPIANGFGDCIPALLAGNAVVLKPSEETPLSAALIAEGLRASGLPEGVFSVATGRGDTGAALIDHVDMVMFTGSTTTGRLVAERAGRNLIPCSLELGGNDPMIVLADADLERAANAAVFYSMQNAGQTCLSVERVYVEAPVYDDFVRRVTMKVRSLRHGAPDGPGSVEVGALTLERQAEIVDRHLSDATARGARILTGGSRNGLLFEPTVLVDVDHSMACMREETFGPTLPIMRVADAEEALRLANDSDYGLAASIFTRDPARAATIGRRLQAGNVAVNDAMVFFAVLELPMGGWKASGVGTRHGAGGIRKYCRTQSVVAARRLPRRDIHMFPYSARRSRSLLRLLRLSSR